ncbi:MAG: magnesium transporter [Pseudomonadota bacterium]|nr:magnesium transporter [Pseudomonadota bacterium]
MNTEQPSEPKLEPIEEIPFLQSLLESWPTLTLEQRLENFQKLSREDAEEVFLNLGAADQYDLILSMLPATKRSWVRLLAPDDAADLIQQFSPEDRIGILALLDDATRHEVTALLAYAEDDAGGLMNSRFIRLRPEASVDVALRYIRAQTRSSIEATHYAYVLAPDQKLLGALSFRDLLLAPPDKLVSEIMESEVVTMPEDMHQEEVSRRFAQTGFAAIPVVDSEFRMKGIVTIDDVVEIVHEEATEDIHKIGGSVALGAPYLDVSFGHMIKQRAFWLTVLFIGEMFTATAMSHYEKDIQRAVVLAFFIPLIISSGGNTGSQAASIIIRALALRQLRLSDWWRVLRREIFSGLTLGAFLGAIGLFRIVFWPNRIEAYGEHYMLIGATVSISLVGVVLWGAIAGSMLPFILSRFKLDPATASTPLVATLVDVTGLVIYFSLANLILSGTIL